MFGDNALSSAGGILSLLDDADPSLNVYALERLNKMVPAYWPEISEKIELIETFYENGDFEARELAALIAAKVYFQIGAMDESLTYALSAGDYFNISESSEFVETIAMQCFDTYIEYRQKAELDGSVEKCDSRMEKLVEKMLYQCLADGRLREAAGIAIETRRYDILEEAIKGNGASEVDDMIEYISKLCLTVVEESNLLRKILLLLVKISSEHEDPNYINVCNCLVHLDDAKLVAEILCKLVKSEKTNDKLVGYQIGFDLYDCANQGFIKKVVAMVGDEEKLGKILSGELTIDHHLQFLIRNNNADLQILTKTKEQVRSTITHNATIISNAMMHAGTTSDKFLRDNLEWLARATNWAKFTATSSLGVIHKGHENDALKLMSVYLPKEGGADGANATTGSPYQDGGGLYAVGLIHANHGSTEIIDYLKNELVKAKSEPAKHGALLGLGLAAMGTHDMELYEIIRDQLCSDDAIVGEAAGIASGLIMVGSNNKDVLEEMIKYAQDTQHEKIIRGLSLGISLVIYGQLDAADDTIKALAKDKDPLLRRAGCLGTGLAWVGTGSNEALSRMLHTAVSDVSDDVRRASVQAIGFILARNPENCPHVVELLSHSYNPHVRAGSATALGISCAATGNKEALTLLEPMMNDPVNIVRQAAVMAAAMILIQHTEHTSNGKSKQFRENFEKMISDKHEDIMGKFGAIVAQGIIDAGGRNCSIHMADTKTGHVHMPSVVGMACFLSSWYWFPMAHFLSLALRPASMIMLNADLNLPKMQVKCAAKPSAFAYPAKIETKKEKKKEKVETAVLSVSAKNKRAKSKEGDEKAAPEKKDEKMETDEKPKETEEEKKEDKKKKEPNFSMLDNSFRALPQQLKLLSVAGDSRYEPMKNIQSGGIILVANKRPDETEEIVERVAAGGPKTADLAGKVESDEAEPPKAFKWLDEYDAEEKPAEEPKKDAEKPEEAPKAPETPKGNDGSTEKKE